MDMKARREAAVILERARAREAARPIARTIDYARMNRTMPAHKARLTRALNITDPLDRRAAVVVACARAVAEWDECGAWPDQWARWNIALGDQWPSFHAPELGDLR